MLKALELAGFKSFAEKIRFEFPEGITVVVGPNGSGKSNIVDSIKWILGSQSAKSLRGKEMQDVIFKGSSTRNALNSAEATLVVDNTSSLLDVEDDEVRLTRRVYRSGENEYSINGNICRLKDLKNLLRGSGIGADAYSIIEQGKLDLLLSTASKDRRTVFEDAAGISRFKAKKLESLRRLERVSQNMERLADIVGEVDGRLQSIRTQASKAEKFRKYKKRLKDLKVWLYTHEWHHANDQAQKLSHEQAELESVQEKCNTQLDHILGKQKEVDIFLENISFQLSKLEGNNGRLLESRASLTTDLHQLAERIPEQRRLSNQYREQRFLLNIRRREKSALKEEAQKRLSAEKEKLDNLFDKINSRQETTTLLEQECQKLKENLFKTETTIEKIKENKGEQKSRQLLQQTERERLENEQSKLLAQEELWHKEYLLFQQELKRAEEELREKEEELFKTRTKQGSLEKEFEERQQEHQKRQQELLEQISKRQRLGERAAILADLEEKQEGVGMGVRQLLSTLEGEFGPLYDEVHGLVADLIQVDISIAHLIDLALGNRSQHIVVQGEAIYEKVRSQKWNIPGRVSLISLSQLEQQGRPTDSPTDRPTGEPLENISGVIGRADRLIEFEPQHQTLMEHLLGTTWITNDLSTINRLNGNYGLARFVTLHGEVLEPDGIFTLGNTVARSGLISRRSELRSLRIEIERSTEQEQKLREEVTLIESALKELKQETKSFLQQEKQGSQKLSKRQAKVETLYEQQKEYHRQKENFTNTKNEIDHKLATIKQQQQQLTQEQSQIEQELNEQLQRQKKDRQELAAKEESQQQTSQKITTAQINLAQNEQNVKACQKQLSQLERSLNEQKKEQNTLEITWREPTEKLIQFSLKQLNQRARLDEVILEKESVDQRLATKQKRHNTIKQQKRELDQQGGPLQEEVALLGEKIHQNEIQQNKYQTEKSSLQQRFYEEFQKEISSLPRPDRQDDSADDERNQVTHEIDQLNQKLSQIGSVNMEALAELENLEDRYGSLDTQYQDLVQAKLALDEMIERIDQDSRQLFLESLTQIRINFQRLFRKVFGGGQADIVLEEGVDILDAGIDILATPPGKKSLGISLLSGGEKALTAVTLMLAIFEYRPSPFCILDEVDGPLDEANIDRFVTVLKEFLSMTKFIIISHSKKTMLSADTLYGITMEESGISKKVSIQFEESSDQTRKSPHGATSETGSQVDQPLPPKAA
ncbi:MAG: chromosome segregation protein SMC [Pirellulaceae bacterium]|nr:chromosome segregation protein SMC [Pirellulaceae bacterium]